MTRPSTTPIHAGTAPALGSPRSSAATHSSLRGTGRPWPITLVSSATTSRPSASAPTHLVRAPRPPQARTPPRSGHACALGRHQGAGVAGPRECSTGVAPRASIVEQHAVERIARPGRIDLVDRFGWRRDDDPVAAQRSSPPVHLHGGHAIAFAERGGRLDAAAAGERLGLSVVREHRGRARDVSSRNRSAPNASTSGHDAASTATRSASARSNAASAVVVARFLQQEVARDQHRAGLDHRGQVVGHQTRVGAAVGHHRSLRGLVHDEHRARRRLQVDGQRQLPCRARRVRASTVRPCRSLPTRPSTASGPARPRAPHRGVRGCSAGLQRHPPVHVAPALQHLGIDADVEHHVAHAHQIHAAHPSGVATQRAGLHASPAPPVSDHGGRLRPGHLWTCP